MNLRQHIELTEKAIAAAFVANGLYVHLCGCIQGPHTLTFGLRLYEPTQRNINKALTLSGAIEAAIADNPIRVYMDRGVILVEAPSPAPVTVAGSGIKGAGFAVPLGMTSRQTIAGIDLLANPHMLLVAPTNRGKTTAARLIAYHLARQNPQRDARFIVSTFKPRDWQAFTNLAHTFAVISEPKESERMIHYLVEVMINRTKSGQTYPHLFVFLDDLLNLLGVASVDDALAQLASLGRGAGIHLIVCTQRLGEKGAAGSMVTGNIPARLVFGTADAQDSAMFTGRGGSGAEKLGRYPGDALLVTDGGVQRLAVGYIADGHLATLRQDASEWRPWQQLAVSSPANHGVARHGVTVGTVTPSAPSHPTVTVSTPVHHTVTVITEGGDLAQNDGADPSFPSRVTAVTATCLPDREPTAEERQYLRRLYEEAGSKREVMRLAWGGVVNDEGNTPKTRRWLEKALVEVITT